MSSNPVHGDAYSIQQYVMTFVSDLRQVGGFRRVSSTNKTDRYDLNEKLLQVTLNIINQPTNMEAITSCLSESDVSLYIICIYVRILASNTI